jgi:hypothetical protein
MTTESWDPALWLLHEDAGGLAGVALCERWDKPLSRSPAPPG